MAIKPICDKCKQELTDFGLPVGRQAAFLLSPPDKDGMVKKWHLCKGYYEEIISNFK